MYKSQKQRLREDMRLKEMTPQMLKKYGVSKEEMERGPRMSEEEEMRQCERDANEEEMKDRDMAIEEMKHRIHGIYISKHPDKAKILKKMHKELSDTTKEGYSFDETYVPAYYNDYHYFRPRRLWRWRRRGAGGAAPWYRYYYRPYNITGNNYFRPDSYMFSHIW